MATKKQPTCSPTKLKDYAEQVADAEKRLEAGEKQKRCACCQKWRWPHEKPVEA